MRAGDNGFQDHESIPKQGADVGVFDRQGNMVMDILDIQRSSQVFDEGPPELPAERAATISSSRIQRSGGDLTHTNDPREDDLRAA